MTSCIISIESIEKTDILTLSEQIQEFLNETTLQDRSRLQQELEKLEDTWDERYGQMSIFETRRLQQRREEIEEELEEQTSAQKFQKEFESILQDFEEVGPREEIIRLGKKKSLALSDEDKIRIGLVEQFLIQLEGWEPMIQVIRSGKVQTEITCSNCKTVLPEERMDGHRTCIKCGLIQRVLVTHSYISSNPNSPEETAQDFRNFKEEIQIDQGNSVPTWPENFFEKLTEYLQSIEQPVRKDIEEHPEKYPLLRNGSRENTSRTAMFAALKACGFSKYYRYIKAICAEIWLWNIFKYPHLEELLLEDFSISQPFFRARVAGERSSSNNVQFRLFVHLWRYRNTLEFHLDEANYRVPTTEDIREKNQKTWTEVCSDLDWESPFEESGRKVTLGGKKKKKQKPRSQNRN